jgi:hypothetical protein
MKFPLAVPLLLLLAQPTLSQQTGDERRAVPGRYVLGLYADGRGTSNRVELESGQDKFEAWIGISGDSTRIFSAAVFRLNVPRGLRIDGPIQWKVVHGLAETGIVTDPGVQVEFNIECLQQLGSTPVMLGRVPFAVDRRDFESGTVEVLRHDRWGLSVELCQPEKNWPKPFCDPVHLEVTRNRSFWQKLKNLFG